MHPMQLSVISCQTAFILQLRIDLLLCKYGGLCGPPTGLRCVVGVSYEMNSCARGERE